MAPLLTVLGKVLLLTFVALTGRDTGFDKGLDAGDTGAVALFVALSCLPPAPTVLDFSVDVDIGAVTDTLYQRCKRDFLNHKGNFKFELRTTSQNFPKLCSCGKN